MIENILDWIIAALFGLLLSFCGASLIGDWLRRNGPRLTRKPE